MATFADIDSVVFGIIGTRDVSNYSHATIISEELFLGTKPVDYGLYTTELGADPTYPCKTCGKNYGTKNCLGHFGEVQLKYPLLNPLFIKNIGKWLKVGCISCGTPLLDLADFAAIPASKRLTEYVLRTQPSSGKTVTCRNPKCKKVQPKIEKNADDYISFSTVDVDGSIRRLHPHDIKTILARITNETVVALGSSPDTGPAKLVLDKILIPPVTIRPGAKSIIAGSPEGASYHDIVTFLQYIVKKNNAMSSIIPQTISGEDYKKIANLQQLYYELIAGSSVSPTGTSTKRGLLIGNKQTPSIMKRLFKKTGRIRGNLLGKRAWWISRTTISGNPRIRIDDVIIPYQYARVLQGLVTALDINKNETRKYLTTDSKFYPRATRVITPHGVYDTSKYKDGNLESTNKYLRDIIDDDPGIINRQPSLEESAIQVHNVIVAKDPAVKTMQINVIACKWYNADFDGDQMSCIIPRHNMTKIETKILSAASNRFISGKTSGPVNGQVHDSVIGCFELTKSTVRLNRYHAMSMYAVVGDIPILPNNSTNIYTGRDIISGILQKYPITLTAKPTYYDEALEKVIAYNPDDTKVVISPLGLQSGVLDKKTIGEGATGGIFHLISRQYGSKKALNNVFDYQQIALNFMANKGFSVSLSNLVLPSDILTGIHNEISGLLRDAENINEQLIAGEILPPIGMTVHEFYEKLQSNALKDSDLVLKYMLKGMDTENNGMYKMPATGARGNWPNLKHITAMIGQIEVNQERIQDLFSFHRTSPYHPKFTTNPRAYGFIGTNYVSGMRADEFIYADMFGRYDLINKALSTAKTGYQMRKSIDGLQSAIVDYYRRVCINNRVIEYLYGEDGLDPKFVENVKFPTVVLNNADLESKYKNSEFPEEFEKIREDRDRYRSAFLGIEYINFNTPMSDIHILPINIERQVSIILSGKRTTETKGDRDIKKMVARVKEETDNIPYVLINEIQLKQKAEIPKHISAASSLLQMSMRCELNSKNVLPRLSMEELEFILIMIKQKYTEALINYGAGIGFSASQAICEPLTQYMLDSHKRSVVGGTNQSGITRVTEILGAKPVEEEQSSEMMFRVLPEFEKDPIKVREIANSIELLTFGRFIRRTPDKLFESYGKLVYPPLVAEDSKWVAEFEESHPLIKPPADLSNWCIWVELDKSVLLLKGIELETIVEKLRFKHPDLFIIHNAENSPKIRLRIYVRTGYFGKNIITLSRLDDLIDVILATPIRGILGIQNVNVVPISRQRVDPTSGAIVKDSVYAIKTVGTNIYGVSLHKHVDPYSIVSTSIGDTYKMFGIEAARQKIISELGVTVESAKPSVRHVQVYANVMTCTSKVTNLEKKGLLAREKNNVLLNSALMDPIGRMKEASTRGAQNKIYGVAAPLMMGALPRLGSTYCDVMVNEEFVKKNIKNVSKTLDELE